MKKQIQKIEQPLGFLTQDKLDVTERIKKEKTLPFTHFADADKYAREIRSYTYDLYCYNSTGKITHYGWAVPK